MYLGNEKKLQRSILCGREDYANQRQADLDPIVQFSIYPLSTKDQWMAPWESGSIRQKNTKTRQFIQKDDGLIWFSILSYSHSLLLNWLIIEGREKAIKSILTEIPNWNYCFLGLDVYNKLQSVWCYTVPPPAVCVDAQVDKDLL